MSKKRQKKKAARKQRQQPSPQREPDIGKQIAAVAEALRQGRARRAWGVAKPLLHRKTLEPAQRDTVLKALSARAEEMVQTGHAADAPAFVNTALKGTGTCLADLDSGFRLLLECCGGEPDLLRQYETSEDIRAEADDVVRTTGELLMALCDHPSLPAEHPLKQQACTIRDAWEEIETDALGPDYQALSTIPRRSPFSDWRLFLQGLQAFYTQHDNNALANVNRIRKGSGPHPLGDAIRCVIENVSRKDRWFRKLKESLAPGFDLQLELRSLKESIDEDNLNAACRRAGRVSETLARQGRPSLGIDVGAFVQTAIVERYGTMSGVSTETVFELSSNLGNLVLGTARGARMCVEDYPDAWEVVLEDQADFLGPRERAVIMSHIARLLERDLDADFGLERDYDLGPDFDLGFEDMMQIEEWYDQSIASCPLPQTYRQWIALREKAGAQARDIAERWHEQFPDDTEALRQLCTHSRRSGRLKQAREALEGLKAIEGNSPELRSMETFLMLEEAATALARGQTEPAEEILSQLDEGSTAVAVAAQAVRYLHADQDQRSLKIMAGKALGAQQSPWLVWHIFRLLKRDSNRSTLPASVKRQLNDPDLLVQSLPDLAEIEDPDWALKGDLWCDDLDEAAEKTSAPVEALLRCLQALTHLDPGLNQYSMRSAALTLAQNGLRRDTAPKAPFLAYAAMVFHSFSRTSYSGRRHCCDKSRDCLMAAARIDDAAPASAAILTKAAHATAFLDYREKAETLDDEDVEAILDAVRDPSARYLPWNFHWNESQPGDEDEDLWQELKGRLNDLFGDLEYEDDEDDDDYLYEDDDDEDIFDDLDDDEDALFSEDLDLGSLETEAIRSKLAQIRALMEAEQEKMRDLLEEEGDTVSEDPAAESKRRRTSQKGNPSPLEGGPKRSTTDRNRPNRGGPTQLDLPGFP